MILPFKTKHNGQPTHFVKKIWDGYDFHKHPDFNIFYDACEKYGFDFSKGYHPKPHTIREDKNNRWKPGVMIDFFINRARKNMFRFAPRIPVISTQKIKIEYDKSDPVKELAKVSVYIDDKLFYYESDTRIPASFELYEKMLMFARNDGFNNIVEFFSWFNEDFSGKIIHWTDLKY